MLVEAVVMGVLQSNLFTSAGNNDLEDCAASHVFNFYKGKPANGSRFEAINRIREALRRLGFPSAKDRPGEYGDDTARAVLAYKGPPRNILGPGQRMPDAVVGRQTIMRLDEDLRAAGLGGELPAPPAPLKLGHQFWGYHLTTLTRADTYLLTVQSIDQLEFAHFKFEPRQIINLIGEISGSTSSNKFLHPTLFMTERVQLADFEGASCDIRLRRDQQRNAGMLSGSIFLTTSKGVSGRAEIPSYGEGTNDGLWKLMGKLVGPLDFPALSPSPSAANAGHFSHVYRAARRRS
jgi:hypothetical protein